MNPFGDHRADMVGKLRAAGVDVATVDPAAGAPFVLVGPVTTVAAEGIGSWSSTVPVVIAVPPPGDADALDALETVLTVVYGALGFAPARPGPYTSGAGTSSLPAYQLTYPVSIPNPAC